MSDMERSRKSDVRAQMRARLLDPSVMAAPIVWLCSPAADQVNNERIVATEFKDWLSKRETSPA